MLAAKASANESSAIGSLRALNNAEANYAATCAGGAFAVNIPLLVAQNYLSPDMGFNPKSGYNFGLQAGHDADAGPTDCTGRRDRLGLLRLWPPDQRDCGPARVRHQPGRNPVAGHVRRAPGRALWRRRHGFPDPVDPRPHRRSECAAWGSSGGASRPDVFGKMAGIHP